MVHGVAGRVVEAGHRLNAHGLAFVRVYGRCLAKKEAFSLTNSFFSAKKFAESLCVSR